MSRVRRALAHDEFELHYQPQVELNSRAVVGFEALLRWRYLDGRLVPPVEFIPVAEETGLIVQIVDVNGSNPLEVASEVDRYCSWPGQACGYKVGQ